MSFTHDAVATIRFQMQQMEVDGDPTVPDLVIRVTRDPRNGLLRKVEIDRVGRALTPPPGVLVREALDNQ